MDLYWGIRMKVIDPDSMLVNQYHIHTAYSRRQAESEITMLWSTGKALEMFAEVEVVHSAQITGPWYNDSEGEVA
jgi:hypothetical protein